jgi:hypothetical protein
MTIEHEAHGPAHSTIFWPDTSTSPARFFSGPGRHEHDVGLGWASPTSHLAHLARRYINRWLLLPNPSCLPFFVPPPPLLCPAAAPPGLLCPTARGSQHRLPGQAATGGASTARSGKPPAGASRIASRADTAPHRGSRSAGLEVQRRGTAARSEEAEQGPPTVAVEGWSKGRQCLRRWKWSKSR